MLHSLVNAWRTGNPFRSGLLYTGSNVRNAWKTGGAWSGTKAFGNSLAKSTHTGWEMSFKGNAIIAMPLAAFSFATASRGHKMSAGVSTLSEGVGSFLGGMVAGLPGALIGGFLMDSAIGQKVGAGVQYLHDTYRDSIRLKEGGQYQDTQANFTMRQAALSELAGSLQNARSYLGREGAMMHQ